MWKRSSESDPHRAAAPPPPPKFMLAPTLPMGIVPSRCHSLPLRLIARGEFGTTGCGHY